MSIDYLLKEYEECFIQLRHYDDRQISLLQFAVTISSSMAAGLLAIYEIVDEKSLTFWLILSLVCGCVFVGILILLWGMVQIRLYYVHTARQINALREYLLGKNPGFKNNQMYLTVNISPFKWRSAQVLMILGISLLSFVYLAIGASSLLYYFQNGIPYCLFVGFIFSLIIWCCNTIGIRKYLITMDKKRADEAVHK